MAPPNDLGRVPPHDEGAEQEVLASMMASSEAASLVAGLLNAGHFYRHQNRHIFEAASALFSRSEPIDLVTLKSEMTKRGTLDGDAYQYLVDLASAIPMIQHVAYHAKTVREKAQLRHLIGIGSRLVEMGYEGESAESAITEAHGLITGLDTGQPADEEELIGDILQRNYDDCEARLQARMSGKPSDAIETGFHDLDRKFVMAPGELIVVAARPGLGKTALAWCIAVNVAKQGHPVMMFTLEMSKEQMGRRIAASVSGVEIHRQMTGFVQEHEWAGLQEAVAKYSGLPIYIRDTSHITTAQIDAACKRRIAKDRRKLGLVVVDYLTLINPGSEKLTDTEAAGRISRALKVMSGSLGCPILVVSQLNRAVESRTDKRPQLSDLRQSGQLEQDASVVLFPYREAYYNPPEVTQQFEMAEVNIAKNRNGPTGKVDLTFCPAKTEFYNYAKEQTFG